MSLRITLFTDPTCPFAFSAEPARLRLVWHYGDQLSWRTRMIVLTLEPGEGEELAKGAPSLQRKYGMPIEPSELERCCGEDRVSEALRSDIAAARCPSLAACALDHKLGGPVEQRRYTAPSYELTRDDDGRSIAIPGFNPIETYEVAIANLAPELIRRPTPEAVADVLAWAEHPIAAGADCYWSLA